VKAGLTSWIILITLAIVWGSSFILMKRGMDVFSSDEVGGLRIAIAFVFLLPLYLRKDNKIDLKKNWRGLVLMGVFGNLIPAFLFTAAEIQISSSLAGMLNALTPLFTISVAVIWFKDKFKTIQVIGILTGLVGASALLFFNEGTEPSKDIMYSLLVVGATICYAISVNGIKHYLAGMNSVTATLGAFSITGPIALAYLLINTDFINDLKTNDLAIKAFGFVCILAIIGTALSVIIYNQLIKLSGALFAATCTYLIPIVAIIWGVLDGETVNLLQIGGIVIIILSVYLINRR
jgi:drug/metabolite transporter (DMT)-like permease